MRQRYAPPPPTPTHPQPNRLGGVGRLLIIVVMVGFFVAVFARAGILAVVLAVALGFLLRNRLHRGRTLIEWVAAGALVLLLVGGAPAPRMTMPRLKFPVTADAAQTEQVKQARTNWSKAFQQWAQAFSEVSKDKEARR